MESSDHHHSHDREGRNRGKLCCFFCKNALKTPKYCYRLLCCLFFLLLIIAVILVVVYDVNLWETWDRFRQVAKEWQEKKEKVSDD